MSNDTWTFQLIIDAFPLKIETGKATGSLRESTFLEESLPVVTLGVVDILGSEPIFFPSLSPEEDKTKASEEVFLEIKEVEILLEDYLAM